jgi:hypothetical protein
MDGVRAAEPDRSTAVIWQRVTTLVTSFRQP